MVSIRLAYIISAYKLPRQLVRLVQRLNTDGASFFVHVDQRSPDEVLSCAIEALGSLPNVYFLERHACFWGDFGHVKATLKGIQRLLTTRTEFDYAVLLTGQDYPLKSNASIREFLVRQGGALFLAHFALPSDEWEHGGMDRIQAWHLHAFGRRWRVPLRRKVPLGLQPYGGSSYWCLPRSAIVYIDSFSRQHPKFVDFFRYVDVPDEIFFQTILLNSPLAPHVVNDDLHYIDWPVPDAGSPRVLRTADLDTLARTDKLFARKFDVSEDATVLDLIDSELLG